VGLDLSPFGGLRKGATTAIIGARSVDEAVTVLKKLKVPEKVAIVRAAEVVAIKTDAQAIKFLEDIAEQVKTTDSAAARLRGGGTVTGGELQALRPGTRASITVPRIPKQLEPLVDVVNKSDTSADFLKTIKDGLIDSKLRRRTVEFATDKALIRLSQKFGVDLTRTDVANPKLTLKKFPQLEKPFRTGELAKDAEKFASDALVDFFDEVKGKVEVPSARPVPQKAEVARAVPARLATPVETPKVVTPLGTRVFTSGKQVGRALERNIQETVRGKVVRKTELKGLREGIKLNNKKNAIIDSLRGAVKLSDNVRKQITEYAKDALPPNIRGKAMTLIRDAKNVRQMTKAFSRIHMWAEEAIKTNLRADLLKKYNSIIDSPAIAVDFKAQIKKLLGDFDFKKHRPATLSRLRATEKWILEQQNLGKNVEMPKKILKELSLLHRTPFEEITISQMRGLHEQMDALAELGKTKRRTLEAIQEGIDERFFQNLAEHNAPKIQANPIIVPEIGEQLTMTMKIQNIIARTRNKGAEIGRAISPMDVIMDMIDGSLGTYDGPISRFFKGRVDAAYGRYNSRKILVQSRVADLASELNLTKGNFERIGVVAETYCFGTYER